MDEQRKPQMSSAPIRRLAVRGSIPSEAYGELFRTIVSPMRDLDAGSVRLRVEVEGEISKGQGLSALHPAVRRLRESALRLGMELVLDEGVGGLSEHA